VPDEDGFLAGFDSLDVFASAGFESLDFDSPPFDSPPFDSLDEPLEPSPLFESPDPVESLPLDAGEALRCAFLP
jgi:hypothetical protein